MPAEVVPIAQRTDMLNHGFAPPPIRGLSVLKGSNLLPEIADQFQPFGIGTSACPFESCEKGLQSENIA